MIITRECDYWVRIVRALGGGGKKTAVEICESEHIPSQFAYKILKKLERAGYILSSRGRDGGYWLVKPIDTFSLYDILSAVDDNLFINECLKDTVECTRNTSDTPCAVHCELKRVQHVLEEELKQKSILQVVTEYQPGEQPPGDGK